MDKAICKIALDLVLLLPLRVHYFVGASPYGSHVFEFSDRLSRRFSVVRRGEMEHLPYSVQIEMAREAGIPVLDGLAVVENMRGEMNLSSEGVLKEEVRQISAAKQGMVTVDDDDDERLKEVEGRTGEAPFTAKTVPVEELLQKDVDQTLWFFGMIEAFTYEPTVAFTIPPTEGVNRFLEEHVRQ